MLKSEDEFRVVKKIMANLLIKDHEKTKEGALLQTLPLRILCLFYLIFLLPISIEDCLSYKNRQFPSPIKKIAPGMRFLSYYPFVFCLCAIHFFMLKLLVSGSWTLPNEFCIPI